MKNIDKLIDYIKGKYVINTKEMDNVGGNKNIKRYTYLTMSGYVENAIAVLINDILKSKGKKYKYIIDAQLSVDSKLYRPDIVIYDDDNNIHGLVEIKAQLGYANSFNEGGSYVNRIKRIRKAKSIVSKVREKSDEIFNLTNEMRYLKELDKVKYKDKIKELNIKIKQLNEENAVNYSANNCKDFVVILTPSVGFSNLKNFKCTDYFVLFQGGKETVWYNNIDKRYLNTKNNTNDELKGHTYDDLVEYLDKNF